MTQPADKLCTATHMTPAGVFTAARIAACLGVTPQGVRKTLRDVPATGARIVGGGEAAAWSVDSLPEAFRNRMEEEARRRGYRDIAAMLADPPKQWQPPMPLDKIADAHIEGARKLRDALRPWLVQQHDTSLATKDLEAKGVADYARVFGHRITGRYWRELFARTLRRDNGAEDWNRLEVYLPERPALKESPARVVTEALAEEFGAVESYINACGNPAAPSDIEERGVWTLAMEKHASLVSGGMSAKRAARRVRSFLFSKAPFHALTRDALLKAFDRKLAGWKVKGVNAFIDGREGNGGDGFEFAQQDLDVIEAKIVFQYGEYPQAWREALAKGELSEETRRRYRHAPARKSQVPKKLISALGQRPIWLYTLHRRRKDFNSMKAHFTTIYDGLATLACISADDVTLPVWFSYRPNPESPPIMTRGQCLVFIDLVSKRILGWSLQPDRNYNALVIYTQMARVMASKGVPRAVLFEHGIWEKAKIITGSAPFSITEVTQGFKEFGIEFFHADTPQGKWEVEQLMGLIQDMMEGEPGYGGRDERRDRPDWIKKQLAEVQSKTNPPDPSKHFYSFEQWNARLAAIFEEYNSSSQGGKLMRDRSPDQVYVDNWNADDPPILLPPELRYRLAHAKYKQIVTAAGVSVTNGGRTFKYFGPELKALNLVGFPALVWFNPEFPDVAVVTDMNEKNPIGVPLHDGVPRLERLTNPGGTVLAEACKRREGQVSDIVARYNVLKDKFELPYRKNLIAAQTLALGPQMDMATAKVRKGKTDQAARVNKMRGQARRLDIPAVMIDDDPDTQRALELMAEAEREHQQGPEKPKVYQLDRSKKFDPKGKDL